MGVLTSKSDPGAEIAQKVLELEVEYCIEVIRRGGCARGAGGWRPAGFLSR